jgi:uncharacterized protein involved in high-affinity Fe2+ transport
MTHFTGNYTVTRNLSRSVSNFTLHIDKKHVVGFVKEATCVEIEVIVEGNKNLNAL